MPDNKKQGRSNKTMTFFVCFLAALAGLLFGLDIGVIAGALPFIANEFQISAHTQEWVVSSMMFGAAVGAVGSGWLSFKLGRKKSLMIGAILFVAGSLFSAAAPNVEILLVSRVLLGLAVGVASYTAPLYLSEIAPEKIRGSMISMYQLMITIGILGAYLSDTAFSYSGAWRWMLGVIIIPAVLLLIGVIFLPDSPRWFAAKRRFVDAERVLLRLRILVVVPREDPEPRHFILHEGERGIQRAAVFLDDVDDVDDRVRINLVLADRLARRLVNVGRRVIGVAVELYVVNLLIIGKRQRIDVHDGAARALTGDGLGLLAFRAGKVVVIAGNLQIKQPHDQNTEEQRHHAGNRPISPQILFIHRTQNLRKCLTIVSHDV